jgi:hypothetical protein
MAVRRTRAWTPKAIPFGLFILLLGLWGIFVPLVGPYFHFGFFTNDTWNFMGRHWELLILPGIAAVLGGLLLLVPTRAGGWLGGMLATAAGIWFLVGPSLYPLWTSGHVKPIPHSETITALLWIGYFYGTGALIAYFAGYGQGLLSRRTVVEETPVAAPTQTETRQRAVTQA